MMNDGNLIIVNRLSFIVNCYFYGYSKTIQRSAYS